MYTNLSIILVIDQCLLVVSDGLVIVPVVATVLGHLTADTAIHRMHETAQFCLLCTSVVKVQ